VARAVEVEHLMDREVGRLSGGEVKRVELATVLAQRPKVALVDEPDSGVYVVSLAVVARGLKELAAGAALVMTHRAHVARSLPLSRLCVLYGGTLRGAEGPRWWGIWFSMTLPTWLEEVRHRAKTALHKPAPYGLDVDVTQFGDGKMPADEKAVTAAAERAGVSTAALAYYIQADNVYFR
jgi:energy-coupling factor transporter ATP-binding protein EcfA2